MKKAFLLMLILPLLAACTGKKPQKGTIASKETETVKKESVQVYEIDPASLITPYQHPGRVYSDENNPLTNFYRSEIQASSQGLEYPAENLIDQTWKTWATAENKGIGEYFTIDFGKGESGNIINHPVAGFALKNGHGNLDQYGKSNRVKSFKIYIDGEYTETIPIKDSISFEQYSFAAPVDCNTVRFEIEEIYTGTEFLSTCVAEIAFMTKTVSDKEFYEHILFWLGHQDEFFGGSQYANHNQEMTSVDDGERLRLLDYLPFKPPVFFGYTEKIALLDKPSSLKLDDNLPRLDGATAMYPLYSAFVHAVYPEIDIDENEKKERFLMALKEWAYLPNLALLRSEFYSPSPDDEFASIVRCSTTSKAYQRLIDGETDIIFCYEPSEAEENTIAEKGKQFHLTPIAKDAFIFIVNEKNTMKNITQKQIRDIYSGRVTNWKSITGIDEPIIAYQRSENSGSQTILQSIMKEDELIRPILDGEWVSYIMGGMLLKVASDYYNYNAAIGYSFLFYVTNIASGTGIKILSVDGVKPEQRTIQNGKYPFSQTVYAITTGDESENTKKFIEWILSAQGQELVAKTGYIPVK